MSLVFRAFFFIAALAAMPGAAVAAPQKVAIFDFQLIDTSLSGQMNGVNTAETARLIRVSQLMRDLVAKSGKFTVVDVKPVAADADKQNLATCNGCDETLAQKLGADLAIVGTVQKVSELILNINLYVRDVKTNKVIGVMSADMRGNTDDSWNHTIKFLVRDRLLQPNFGAHE